MTNPSCFNCVDRAQRRTLKLSSKASPEAAMPSVAVPVQVEMKRRYLCSSVSFPDFSSLAPSIGVVELVSLREVGDEFLESIESIELDIEMEKS